MWKTHNCIEEEKICNGVLDSHVSVQTKVQAPICLEISNFFYYERRFSLPKIHAKSEIDKKHELYFFEFFI
jgi:hypothetical protein